MPHVDLLLFPHAFPAAHSGQSATSNDTAYVPLQDAAAPSGSPLTTHPVWSLFGLYPDAQSEQLEAPA